MSEKYLFCAEINQIQRALFAGDQQRQVVGGSRLLAELGRAAGKLAQADYNCRAEDVLVQDGGNFTLVMPSSEQATAFGEQLATAVHLLLDAPITIAAPEKLPSEDQFASLYKGMRLEMAKQKESGRLPQDNAHAPTIAFCQASGDGLAETHSKFNRYEQERYLSQAARQMGQAGFAAKKGEESVVGEQDDSDDSFLGQIRAAIPDKTYHDWDWAADADSVAAYDGLRNNVAYLIADGNNLGKLFGACQTPAQLRDFSRRFNEITREALARPIPDLTGRLVAGGVVAPEEKRLPLLPLIVAGDDLFVMLPAPYALDFARRFCLAYEALMKEDDTVRELLEGSGFPQPTMSAAVVFCKGSYPYNLAHRRGEELLAETKQLAKRVGREKGEWHSAVSLDFILGGEILGKSHQTDAYRAGMTTYWAAAYPLKDEPPPLPDDAIDLQTFLMQRLPDSDAARQQAAPALGRLPAKRRAEIKTLFDAAALPTGSVDSLQRWNARFNNLRDRIAKTDSSLDRQILDDALGKLGRPAAKPEQNPGQWRTVLRGRKNYQAQAIADLMRVWSYAQLLDFSLEEYKEERE